MKQMITIAVGLMFCMSLTDVAFCGEPPHAGKTVTIVALGASTTAPRGELQVYAGCLKRELPKKGINVEIINAGVGGNTTVDARRRFKKDVLDRHPDLVIIWLGINDSTVDVWKKPPATHSRVQMKLYIKTMEYFVETLHKKGCKVILMTPNCLRWTPVLKRLYGRAPYLPDEVDGFNVLLKSYVDSTCAVALKKKVPVVDVYAAFQAYGRIEGQSTDDLLLDGMHPNDKGHRIVTDLLIPVIERIVRDEKAD